MREIKFRAWDKIGNYMIKQALVTFDGRVFDSLCCKAGHENLTDNVELMQYTGMCDLCEDDIIAFNTFDGMGYVGVIKWGEFCYEVETTDDKAPVLYLMPDVINFETIKILGNIYQNPELLEAAPCNP